MELRSVASAQNGLRFDNRYCWVCRFSADKIVEVRAYLDSASWLVRSKRTQSNASLARLSELSCNREPKDWPVASRSGKHHNTCLALRMFDATVSSNSVVFPPNASLPIART